MELTIELVIIIIALILFASVSALKPKIGLIFIFALLPSYLIRFNVFGIPTTFLEGMIIIYTLIYLVRLVKTKSLFEELKRIIKSNIVFNIILLLFLLSSALAIIYSVDKIAAFGIFKAYFLEPAILLFLFLSAFKEKKDFRHLLTGLSFSVIIVSLADIVQFLTFSGIPDAYLADRRATSFYPYPAALALYLAPLLVIFTVLLFRKKEFTRSLYSLLALSTFLGLIALVFSKAEGGIVAYLVAIFFFGLLSRRRWFVLAGATILIIVVFLLPISRDYVLPILSFQDVSGEVRLVLWEGTFNLLKDRPVLGAGLASFSETYEQYKLARHTELLLYPHNIILNFWVEIGLFGLLSFIGVVVYFFVRAISIIKSELKIRYHVTVTKKVNEMLCDVFAWQKTIAMAALCAMVSIIIYGLVDVPYFKNDLAAQFFLIVGMVMWVKTKK